MAFDIIYHYETNYDYKGAAFEEILTLLGVCQIIVRKNI